MCWHQASIMNNQAVFNAPAGHCSAFLMVIHYLTPIAVSFNNTTLALLHQRARERGRSNVCAPCWSVLYGMMQVIHFIY